jgi:nucleoside-diphosphate-sugar epimerase
LTKEDLAVRVLIRDPAKGRLLPPELQAESIEGDLGNEQSLIAACQDIDTIFHLAGTAHVSNGVKGEEAATQTIVQGTENLLKAAIRQKAWRIVYLSSSLATAAENNAGDITAYGRAKRAAEVLLLDAAEKGQIETVILRPVNVYGAGMKGNIAAMISMIQRGRLPRLPALNSQISLIGVEDLSSALLLAANSELSSRIYTVTDGQVYPIGAIEEAIYRCLGKRLPRWRTPAVILYAASVLAGTMARLSGRDSGISSRTYRNLTMDNLHDGAAICSELGFKPAQNLYQALPEIVDDIANSEHVSR